MTQPKVREIEAADGFSQGQQVNTEMTDFRTPLPFKLEFIHETTGTRRSVDIGNVSREQAYLLAAEHREAGEVLLQVVEG